MADIDFDFEDSIKAKLVVARGKKGDKGDTGYPTDTQVVDAIDTYIDTNPSVVTDPVATTASTWLGQHIQEGYAVDNSLTVAGAAADAKKTGDEITDLKSALNWIGQGKNLCGTDPNVYYPVFLNGGERLTLSTADGSNCGYSGMYLYIYDANKTQLNYYTFPSNVSERTIGISSDYEVRYIRWSRDIHKNLQVEIGETKTEYEPYWGNAFSLSREIEDVSNEVVNLHGSYNIVGNIEDNKYLQNTTGRVFDNDGYRASDFIAITPGNTYKLGLFNQNNAPSFEYNAITVCFYDAGTIGLADTFVYASGYDHTRCDWDGGFIKFIAPNNAYFIRVGVNDSASPLKWFVTDYSTSDLFADGNEIKSQIVTDNTALQGKRIAVFGDSIMGNTRDVTSTPAFISKACGATVFNFGFGGCRMSVHATGWDNCSMYRLADDIYADDFTSLVSAINTGWSGMPGYYRNTVAWLNACDFSKVDAIIIAYGTNDYREPSSTLDNPNNKFDTSTVCGALRYSIKQILSKYPGVQILVTCPIFRTFFQDGTTTPESYSDTKDWGSGTLLQYAEAYKQACTDMNVPFLDLYHETSFNPFTRLYFYPADDGTHPNEKGRERIGNLIGGKIKSLLPSN